MKTILTTFLFVLFSVSVYSQWLPCSGLEGGRTWSVVQIDSFYFANVEWYLYRTPVTLQEEWEDITYYTGRSLYAFDSCMFFYAGMGFAKFTKSFDYGESWTIIDEPNPSFTMCNIGQKIFISEYNSIAWSEDYFETYDSIGFPSYVSVGEVWSKDSVLLVANNAQCPIYQSIDTGYVWDSVTTNGLQLSAGQENYFNSMTVFEDRLFLSASGGTYFLNDDRTSWLETNGSDNVTFTDNAFYSWNDQLYGGNYNQGLFVYNSADTNWGLVAGSPRGVIGLNGTENELLVGSKDGPAFMSDSGIWTTYFDGLNNKQIVSSDHSNDTIYVFAEGELFKSYIHDISFQRIEGITGNNIEASDSVLYVSNYYDVLQSHDFGITWDTINGTLTGSNFNNIQLGSEYIFIYNYDGIYRTKYGHTNWELVISGNYNGGYAVIDSIILINDSYEDKLYRSDDHGETFEEYTGFEGIRKCKSIDQRFYLLGTWKYMYSDDFGETWEIVDVEDVEYVEDIGQTEDFVVLAGSLWDQPRLHFSDNNGATWSYLGSFNIMPVDYSGYSNINICGDRLFIASDGKGFWYRDEVFTMWPDENQYEEEHSFSVYPNPSSGEITIETNAIDTHALIHIHDLQGRVHMSYQMVSEKENLNISNLKKGIYLITVITNHHTQTQKLIAY